MNGDDITREWEERDDCHIWKYAQLKDGTVWRRHWPTGLWQEVSHQ